MSSIDRYSLYRAQFLELRAAQPNDEPGWLAFVRKNALERFLDKGFPTTREEEWRFTNVAPLAAAAFALSVLPHADAERDAKALKKRFEIGELEGHELVFVNGRVSKALSSLEELADGVVVTSLADALASTALAEKLQPILTQATLTQSGTTQSDEDDTPFFDLNEAFLSDGAFIHVPRGVALERPVHLVFLTSSVEPVVTHPRNVIVGEAGSQLRVIESYGGLDGALYWTNAVTQVLAHEGAVIDHYKLQRESASAFHMASLGYVQERSSTVSNHSLSLGGRLARHDIRAELDGEGADVTLNGLYVVKDSQHVDHHTVIDHRVPHCTSRELYKGVLDDASSGVFNGRVIVRADAQKTNSQQSNKNLLLSNDAFVNTNPQLEINADDVKCAHGATIGQLDPEAMFYLRSRGIAHDDARRILTEGFMADVNDRIRLAAVRDTLRRLLFNRAA
ncbi:MAG: Fe-S cluster assembly protein SufD [Acidobacteriota bacterium]|nr:MAG: Fe-S cluster assembly protein SufD [Acidobacteriota bacterium]